MNDFSRMPLVETLFAAAEGRFSFHMPGHRQGQSFPTWLRDKLWTLDTTELEVTGDLNQPAGKVKEAMNLAAAFFGAGHTRFVTTGTTTSLLTALATACPRKSQIILPRRVHQAVMHGVALLDLEPIWADININQDVEEALLRSLHNNPQASAVFVTSPGYDGRTVPLRNIASLVGEMDCSLIVDEAHGSHFVAAPGLLPPSALSQGADLVAMSAHKTLPALTPGSYLHVSKVALESGKIGTDKLGQMLKVFQTSSPSFVIAASLDYARFWLESEGQRSIEKLLTLISQLDQNLPTVVNRTQTEGSDPLRLTYDYRDSGLNRLEVQGIFNQYKVDPEIIDLNQIILIPALDAGIREFKALALALNALGAAADTGSTSRASNGDLSWIASLLDSSAPSSIPISKVMFGNMKKTEVPLRNAHGRVAAEAIVPYPPGVAMVWPGEIITPERIEAIEQLISANIAVYGVHKPDSYSVIVLE